MARHETTRVDISAHFALASRFQSGLGSWRTPDRASACAARDPMAGMPLSREKTKRHGYVTGLPTHAPRDRIHS
jgi:hypothetical protein